MRIYSATEYCIFSTPFPKSHTTASVRLAHSHVHWHAYLSWQLPSFTGCQTVVKRDSAAHAKALRLVYAEGAHVRQGQEDFGAKAMTGDVFRQFSANVAQPVDLAPALAAAVSVKPSRIGKHAGNGLFLTTSASLCYPLHLLLTGTARVANDITHQEVILPSLISSNLNFETYLVFHDSFLLHYLICHLSRSNHCDSDFVFLLPLY